jgi:hypothetical protein
VVTTDAVSAASSEQERTDAIAVILLLAVIALAPIARGWVLWSASADEDANQWVLMTPLDWPMALLIVVQLASVVEDRRRGHRLRRTDLPAPVLVLLITLGWLAIAAAVHPSWRALDLAFRLAGVWAIGRTVRRANVDQRTAFLAVLLGLGVLQALLGIAQSLSGDALGLDALEFEGPLYQFGTEFAGRGSLTHPYHLTSLLVVCVAAGALLALRLAGRAQTAALIGIAVMGTGIVLTFSRSGFLAVGGMLVLWVLRRHTRTVAAALAAGLLIGAFIGFDGLTAKAEVSTSAERIDSGRRERIREAAELASQEPVFGVGPGRYVIELREIEHQDLLPAHNIVAQQAAESGYVGGLLTLATLGSFGLWVVRRSPMTMAVAFSLLPFHLLDAYPHTFPLGFAVSGFWLAAVMIAVDHSPQPDPVGAGDGR